MPYLSDIEYSRDACVDAVRGYFRFLTQMYLDPADVVEPPAGGWPSITRDTLAGVGKTDEVLALLRRLPYLRASSDGRRIQGAAYAAFANWAHDAEAIRAGRYDADDLKTTTESASLCDVVPPHVVGLTEGPRETPVFLLDTARGIVLWHECPGEIKHGSSSDGDGDGGGTGTSTSTSTPIEGVLDDPYDYESDEEQATWRGDSAAWAVPDFFAMLADLFRRLLFVPLSKHTVHDAYIRGLDPDLLPAVRAVYRKHHWPDLVRYDKAACMAELRATLRTRFPQYAED
ncbi:hypothetical protein SPI_00355 [Niveomyces insectorum RCEF 264]|uniref:Uncharacterized protein n=1 Tax=Niveomyces insectorum RCEF 264 TaxID=1081102 RepID=A0A168A2E7_9HYPO|nr:hypothetical protein SPI_00355 [Niveomyces insectorum RCEF 264]